MESIVIIQIMPGRSECPCHDTTARKLAVAEGAPAFATFKGGANGSASEDSEKFSVRTGRDEVAISQH